MRVKTLLFIPVLLMLAGCNRNHESELKTEKAEVLQLAFIPSTFGIAPGISSKGNVVVSAVSTDEVWAVVVRCIDHGKTFSLRGKEIYNQCRVGQIVTLEYVEYTDAKGNIVDYETKRVIPENKNGSGE